MVGACPETGLSACVAMKTAGLAPPRRTGKASATFPLLSPFVSGIRIATSFSHISLFSVKPKRFKRLTDFVFIGFSMT